MQIFQFLIFLFALVFFHELGHVISAKLLGLYIQKIGFQFKPFPHFYVAVNWPKKKIDKLVYLFSGTFLTLILFAISTYNNFFELSIIYWVFFVQLIIEFNPFYSDFTIAFVSNKKLNKTTKSYADNYYEQFKRYQFSAKWYLHFIIWTLIIILLINLKKQLV